MTTNNDTQWPSEVTVNFMLAESKRISERWTEINQTSEARLNMFLSIASAGTGILLIVGQLGVSPNAFLETASIVSTIVWLFGLITFLRMLDRNIVATGYMRATNRINRFFVDLDPKIERYLSFSPTDSEPRFATLGTKRIGARTFSALICSLAFGMFCTATFSLLLSGSQISGIGIVVGLATWVLHVIAIEGYATVQFEREEKRYDVRFPPLRVISENAKGK